MEQHTNIFNGIAEPEDPWRMSRNLKENPTFTDKIRFWLFAIVFPIFLFIMSVVYIFAVWVLNPIFPNCAYWYVKFHNKKYDVKVMLCCVRFVCVLGLRKWAHKISRRNSVILFSKLFCAPNRVQHYFVHVVSHACGLSSELRDGEKLKNAPKAVIVMNHQSMWDLGVVLSIYSQLGDTIHAVSKSEVFYYWPMGYAMYLSGSLFIDRKNPKGALESLISMAKKIFSPSNPLGSKIIMYPEGTRNPKIGGDFLPFKRGAFKVALACNVPVIPMVSSPHNFFKSFQYLKQAKLIIRCLDPVMIDPNAELDPQIESIKCNMQREYTNLMNELGITPEK